jgi:hypothetical protein
VCELYSVLPYVPSPPHRCIADPSSSAFDFLQGCLAVPSLSRWKVSAFNTSRVLTAPKVEVIDYQWKGRSRPVSSALSCQQHVIVKSQGVTEVMPPVAPSTLSKAILTYLVPELGALTVLTALACRTRSSNHPTRLSSRRRRDVHCQQESKGACPVAPSPAAVELSRAVRAVRPAWERLSRSHVNCICALITSSHFLRGREHA